MVHTLYLATAGSAALDIRDDARIRNIVLSSVDAAAGGCEVSFTSTPQLTTNDTTGVMAGYVLAGAATGPVTGQFMPDEKVEAGERIYLHVTGANNATRAFIFTDVSGSRPTTRRR